MTLEQMRERLAEIANRIDALNAVEKLGSEEINEVNSLNEEFKTLSGNIDAKEKMAAMVASTKESARKVVPQAAGTVVVEAKKASGFKSAGEFFMAVKKASFNDVDARFNNTAFEKEGQDGGYLIPSDFMSEIHKKIESDESLLSRTTQYKVNGNSLTFPIDESTPWSGGVEAYWTAEGRQITDSKPEFATASLRLHKLAALVKATDELLEDTAALESYIRKSAPEAINHKINEAILLGNGTGKPTGLLNSGFKVTVAKEVGQDADTVVAENIVQMYSRMLPRSRANAVWYINPMVEPQLRLMKDGAGNYIYMAPGSQMNQTPYGMLMGRPVVPMLGSMPELGDEGDIVFADLGYYYTILKASGVKNSVSTHLYFDRDITAFKFTMRLDGACPFSSPVSPEKGNYNMSGFVTLAAR